MVGADTRHYFLHVPKDYACDDKKPWPLLVDFHGTGFGSMTDPVEESWAFPEMIEAADTEHFIVVRPRSLPTKAQGGYVYQWDLNPGDLDLNHDFALQLVADLESHYAIDPARVYAMGFSNGPTMANHFLADNPSIMHGYASISGGLNESIPPGAMLDGPDAPRVYEMTGYRDYMGITRRNLNEYLNQQKLPADHIFFREADTGHELYGWHFHEAFRWMDKGEKPAAGKLSASWTKDATFAGKESLIQAAFDPAGRLNVAGTGGVIYRQEANGWKQTATLAGGSAPLPLTDICFLQSGEGFAAGDGWLATSKDGSSWSVAPRVPEYGAMQFGYTHVTSVGCGKTGKSVLATGVWSAAMSADGATTWSATTLGDQPPFFSQARQLESGAWIGIGYYDSIARSNDGVTFDIVAPPADTQWLNGLSVIGSHVWIVGEKSTIFTSSDDGQSFTTQQAPGTEDLYAVAFSTDAQRGVAVGAHGTAYVTTDGGATWKDQSTGLDGFLGDAVFAADDHTVIVVGADGAVLSTSL
jgi:predicted esterase